ncbi:hypothetical protein BJX70DRAFT_403635 [Aspergillus crustosus]
MGDSKVYDFIIVGAGTAGCMIAARLAAKQPTAKILLVEAGPDTSERNWQAESRGYEHKYADLDYNYKTTPQVGLGNRAIPYARGKGLGGSSTLNRLIWTIGGQDDYNHWADVVGDPAWRWESVLEKYKQIIKLHDGLPDGFDGSVEAPPVITRASEYEGKLDVSLAPRWIPGTSEVIQALLSAGISWNSDMNTGRPLGLGLVWNSTDKKTRATSYTAYLRDAASTPNLTIRTDSPVDRIILEDQKATGLELRGGEKVHATSEIILAGGAFNSPQLLLLSGIGPSAVLESADIPTKVDLPGVGQNLGDHPRVHIIAVLNKDPSEIQEMISPDMFDTALIIWCQLPGIRETDEFKALAPEVQKFITLPHNPTCEIYMYHKTIMPHPNDPSIKLLNIMIANMNVQAKGSISLNSPDPQANPTINPNLLGHAFDRRVMIEGVKEAMRLLTDSPLKSRIQLIFRGPASTDDADIEAFVSQWADTTWHASGTVKMGVSGGDDGDVCVGSDFVVKGVRGLRVADLSVYPFVPNAHTQAAACLIGWVAAEKISSDFAKRI